MAFLPQQKKNRGRYQSGAFSEINVTPFVDVMLVLLIVFMISAPLLTVGVPVDLPKTQAKQLNEDEEPLAISVKANGDVYIQEVQIDLEQIVAKLEAITDNGYDQRIFIRAADGINYGHVVEIMARINKAGFSRIGLVTRKSE